MKICKYCLEAMGPGRIIEEVIDDDYVICYRCVLDPPPLLIEHWFENE